MATPSAGRPDPRRREPLWDRVDKNRFRLVIYLVIFAIACSVMVAAAIGAVALILRAIFSGAEETQWLVDAFGLLLGGGFGRLWALGFVTAIVYEAWALLRSEGWLLRRLGAGLVPKGVHLDAKLALKDMAIASGMPVAPSLHLIDTPNVNAFVFSAPRRRPVVGVTAGLITRLSIAEQRAVFANLVARLESGDTMVSSAVASLLAPLQWYRAHRIRALDIEDKMISDALEERREDPLGMKNSSPLPASTLFLPVLAPVILAGEILAALQRRSQLTAAEKADAEGMLYLKDPDAMLSALEHSIRLNNNVCAAGESFGDLFYCWTGDSTDDESDPEWRRVKRLREVLGVWGWVPEDGSIGGGAEAAQAATVAPRPRVTDET